MQLLTVWNCITFYDKCKTSEHLQQKQRQDIILIDQEIVRNILPVFSL